jgi:hypothetical protein
MIMVFITPGYSYWTVTECPSGSHRRVVISVLVVGRRVTAGGRLVRHRAVTDIRRCWAELEAARDTQLIRGVSRIRGQISEMSYPHKNTEKSSCQHVSANNFQGTAQQLVELSNIFICKDA